MRTAIACLFLMMASVGVAYGAAPTRVGQPYAEATVCAGSDVIFCEDFNYPANTTCTACTGACTFEWTNPGLVNSGVPAPFSYCFGLNIPAATDYPTKPSGALPSGSQPDHVWMANWDSAVGPTGHGGSNAVLRNPGGNYLNGSAPATDFYVRFQFYVTADYAWPGDPRSHNYNYGASGVDNKILFVYPAGGISNPTDAAYDGGLYTANGWNSNQNIRYADVLNARVGNNDGGQYPQFIMNALGDNSPGHMEYIYQCAANTAACWRNPHDTPVAIAFDNPGNLGRAFRFDTNKWYTIEMRYALSNPEGAHNGIIEIWVDGTRIYSANDLETCGTGNGDCSGLGEFIVTAYHNNSDTTNWDGQQIIDDLVISKSYIGPPSASSGPTQVPTAPTGVSITP